MEWSRRAEFWRSVREKRKAGLSYAGIPMRTVQSRHVLERSAPKPSCSFCNRSENEVKELISSPMNEQLLPPPDHFVYICPDCVAVCHELLNEMREDREGTIEPS
jgi:hypothetical protein